MNMKKENLLVDKETCTVLAQRGENILKHLNFFLIVESIFYNKLQKNIIHILNKTNLNVCFIKSNKNKSKECNNI